jgi:hypothetical protein
MSMWRTIDGGLRGLRILACVFLIVAGVDVFVDGWRSMDVAGAVLVAAGLLAMPSRDDVQRPESTRSPLTIAGIAAAVFGFGLRLFDIFAERG